MRIHFKLLCGHHITTHIPAQELTQLCWVNMGRAVQQQGNTCRAAFAQKYISFTAVRHYGCSREPTFLTSSKVSGEQHPSANRVPIPDLNLLPGHALLSVILSSRRPLQTLLLAITGRNHPIKKRSVTYRLRAPYAEVRSPALQSPHQYMPKPSCVGWLSIAHGGLFSSKRCAPSVAICIHTELRRTWPHVLGIFC